MVFEPDSTTTDEQSDTNTDSSADISLLDTLERLSTMLQPFVQLVTVIVSGLNVFILARQL